MSESRLANVIRLSRRAKELSKASKILIPTVLLSWLAPFPAAFASKLPGDYGFLSALDMIAHGNGHLSFTFFILQFVSVSVLFALAYLSRKRFLSFVLYTVALSTMFYLVSEFRLSLDIVKKGVLISSLFPIRISIDGHTLQSALVITTAKKFYVCSLVDSFLTLLPRYIWLISQSASLGICLEYIRVELIYWVIYLRYRCARKQLPKSDMDFEDYDDLLSSELDEKDSLLSSCADSV
ncbi:hypothetical protein V1511DRAFT_513472 [Dipodascopsis uninucleata]